jgi:3-methylcrotonyl-CoA carboxylase alpha subunit
LAQEEVVCSGHAIEARVYAEDPVTGFVPVTGVVRRVAFRDAGVRVDSGVDEDSVISPYYDPMIAKLIARGPDRSRALDRLAVALRRATLLGVATNISFLEDVLAHPAVRAGEYDNRFIDTEFAGWSPAGHGCSATTLAVAGAVWLIGGRSPDLEDPWTSRRMTGWRHADGTHGVSNKPSLYLEVFGESHPIHFSATGPEGRLQVTADGDTVVLAAVGGEDGRYRVDLEDTVLDVSAVIDDDAVYVHGPFGNAGFRIDPYLAHAGAGAVDSGRLLAPMMGRIVKVNVREGDHVRAGDVIMVQESMKIEFRIVAPFDGVVATLAGGEGDMVERNGFVAEIDRVPDAGGTPVSGG